MICNTLRVLRFLAVAVAMLPVIAPANDCPLDVPIHVSGKVELWDRRGELCSSLAQQEAVDFTLALQLIDVHCTAAIRMGLSKHEGDALFVGLIDGHTPRQVILIAAGLALADSAPVTDPERSAMGVGAGRDESAHPNDYVLAMSQGRNFVRIYAGIGDSTKKDRESEPIRGVQVLPVTSATPPTNATSARPAGTK